VLADARRRLLNCGGGAVEAGRRLGLADGADIRVIEFGNQLRANTYSLTITSLRRSLIGGPSRPPTCSSSRASLGP
jgi:hypothetical protein